MDGSRLGTLVSKQLEAIEDDYGEQAELGAVCSIVEVLGPNGPEVRIRHESAGPPHTLCLLTAAQASVLGMG